MADSMTGIWFGVIVLIVAANRRERHRNRQLRWLDTHLSHDWMHHRR